MSARATKEVGRGSGALVRDFLAARRCAWCGARPAPFGYRVSLTDALAGRGQRFFGEWACGEAECRTQVKAGNVRRRERLKQEAAT